MVAAKDIYGAFDCFDNRTGAYDFSITDELNKTMFLPSISFWGYSTAAKWQRYRKFVTNLQFADNRIAEGTIFASLLLSKQSAAPSIKLFILSFINHNFDPMSSQIHFLY